MGFLLSSISSLSDPTIIRCSLTVGRGGLARGAMKRGVGGRMVVLGWAHPKLSGHVSADLIAIKKSHH